MSNPDPAEGSTSFKTTRGPPCAEVSLQQHTIKSLAPSRRHHSLNRAQKHVKQPCFQRFHTCSPACIARNADSSVFPWQFAGTCEFTWQEKEVVGNHDEAGVKPARYLSSGLEALSSIYCMATRHTSFGEDFFINNVQVYVDDTEIHREAAMSLPHIHLIPIIKYAL